MTIEEQAWFEEQIREALLTQMDEGWEQQAYQEQLVDRLAPIIAAMFEQESDAAKEVALNQLHRKVEL